MGLVFLPNGPPPQHRPHHPHQVVRGGHQGNLLPLRIIPLSPLAIGLHGWRASLGLPGRLGDQLANHRRALAGDVPEPVPVTRVILAGHEAEVPADGLGVWEAMRVVHERGDPFRRLGTNSGNALLLVRHVYFCGADEPSEKLNKALRAAIDEAEWANR